MVKIGPTSLNYRLRKAGIRHHDELIHDQPREWLIKNFSKGATDYPVNVSRLMRNIVWQMRERIKKKEKPPFRELIRTFWYMYIKPTLDRAGALSNTRDQYVDLSDALVFMVKKIKIMRYRDIGFRDENRANRRVGANANIILFSEKLGHQDFLGEIADKYDISIIALGGQPSVLNVEYFVDEIRKTGFNLKRSFYLFSVVDYDPSGWIIRDAFVEDLKVYGISNVSMTDLINPDMLKPEEIKLAKYRVPAGKDMRVKNQKWLREVARRNYANQGYLTNKVIYGLEAESISAKRLENKLEEVMVPLLGKEEEFLMRYELKKLDKSIKALIVHNLT